jgi:hypothetical protein
MNIASWFSAYCLLESELRRERVLRRRDELRYTRERQKLIDAIQRNANKSPVFDKPPVPKSSPVPPVAFGPTMSAARQEAKRKEAEIIERAEAARAPSNGHKVDAPEIPSE